MSNILNQTGEFEEIHWDEAYPDFLKVNPTLVEIISERKPNKRFTFFRARYPYGSMILQNGLLHLPNKNGEVVPIDHPTIDESIRNRLSYSNFPLGLMTNNAIEVSREVDSQVITLRFFLPGTIMGLWETLSPTKSNFPTKIWTVTAGARFIFTLPKIQAEINYARLRKRFDLPFEAPRRIDQQWKMFHQIANHENFKNNWYQEIYFFPKEWIEFQSKNIDWIKFHYFLLEQAWEISEYARNVKNQDVIWDLFAKKLSSQGRKPNPYHVSILKHLIGMALGDIPGIIAAGKSDVAAPVHSLQDALIEHYHLKQYVPTIMHPYHFSTNGDNDVPIYYSYNASNLLTSLPRLRKATSTLSELLFLHELMEKFIETAKSKGLNIENTHILDVLEKVKFTFFHSDATGSYKGKILNTREMPDGDPRLLYLDKKYDKREFSESSHFIRGCIRLSKK